MTTATMPKLDTRAVARLVIGGDRPQCDHCKQEVLWSARKVMWIVYANIYAGRGKNRKWNRMEKFHEACYDELGQPYGEATKK